MAQVAITKTQFQTKLRKLLENDDTDCKLLADAYNEAATCAESNPLVSEHILKFDPNFFERAKQGIADLKEVDRPILVIGETSAGKSSFLNLLIGRKVLPELTAPCTHCMCCIKKGKKLEARVSSFDGSSPSDDQIIRGDGITDGDFRAKLEDLVNEDNCEQALDRCIDIFVPSNMLEDNVYLVDTPGFGENEQVTKSLVKFLPKAIGIIFILNPTVGLGIADDRGVLILDEIKRLIEEGKIPSFDPSKIVFIANKWDQVKEEERKDHRRKIIQKMEKLWPKFQADQLLPLSVSYVLRTQDSGVDPDDYKSMTADYQTVLNKIQAIIQSCANARSSVHRGYLDKVLKHLKTLLGASRAFTALSDEEKHKKIQIMRLTVSDMEFAYMMGIRPIEDFAGYVKKDIVKDVHQYLSDAANREKIFIWKNSNTPKSNDYSTVKMKARVAIRSFISEAIGTRIAQYTPEVEKLENKLSKFTLDIKKYQDILESHLNNADKEAWAQKEDNNTDLLTVQFGFAKTTIATIVLTSPLWIPLGIAGIVTVLPVTLAVELTKGKLKSMGYRAKTKEHLERWTEKILREEYTLPVLEHIIFKRLTDQINDEMDSIAKSITQNKNLLQHLDRTMQSEVVPDDCSEMRSLCCRVDGILTNMQQS